MIGGVQEKMVNWDRGTREFFFTDFIGERERKGESTSLGRGKTSPTLH